VGSSSSIRTEPEQQQSLSLDLRHAPRSKLAATTLRERGFERRGYERCGRPYRRVEPVVVERAT